ncbi:PfkB family carbohydrate kinase [Pelagibacteraceae bacterium]|nr:PfkB family carbohydrate kinase [Pelagibacteraceae bacterium]
MKKKKKILITGVFNVLHPGHLQLFRFAKRYADDLYVGVLSDKYSNQKIYLDEKLRLEALRNNTLVTKSFIINSDIKKLINKLRPEYVAKGKEFEDRFNPEKEALEKYGGKIIFNSGVSILSGSDLVKKEMESAGKNVIFPNDYLLRHNINNLGIKKILNKFSKLNICIFGDLIVDEYIASQPLGMSREDPTIVVSPISKKKFIGGSGIVACHAANLNANVNYLTVSGDDEQRDFAIKNLNKFKVKHFIPIDKTRPTTFKQRYRVKQKTLFKVSDLGFHSVDEKIIKKVKRKLNSIISKSSIDLIIFSDFNYGFLTTDLINYITGIAREKKIKIIADCQTSSQYGNILKYNFTNLITPTETEARVSLHDYESGIVDLIHKMQKESKFENVFLKLGNDGFIVQNNNENTFHTDKIEALNYNPVDAAGAGDSLLTFAGMAIASGASIWEAAYLGALAASVQVSRLGNVPISKDDILKNLA